VPAWLLSALKTIGSLLVPEIVRQVGAALRDWIADQKIKRQDKSNKDKAKKYEKDKSKSSANDLIDGL
jgi:uncharacterized protein (UPF0218 family)